MAANFKFDLCLSEEQVNHYALNVGAGPCTSDEASQLIKQALRHCLLFDLYDWRRMNLPYFVPSKPDDDGGAGVHVALKMLETARRNLWALQKTVIVDTSGRSKLLNQVLAMVRLLHTHLMHSSRVAMSNRPGPWARLRDALVTLPDYSEADDFPGHCAFPELALRKVLDAATAVYQDEIDQTPLPVPYRAPVTGASSWPVPSSPEI